MIHARELSKAANIAGVRPQHMEKDYVISWILWGIAQNDLLKEQLVFKGGTCIKKIHIEDYRYSEDMDYTMIDDSIADDTISTEFGKIFELIARETRMRLSIEENSKEIHTSSGSIKFYINYVGPLGGNGDHVKIDITRGERLEYDPIQGSLLQKYSDLEELEFTVKSYCLEEVLIEKMTALMGRTEPRDLYDFDYLTDIEQMDIEQVYYEFERKAANKGLDPADFVAKVSGKEAVFQKSWNSRLQHQIKDLPNFKDVWRSVGKQLRKVGKVK